jgi:gas vesicle protein
MFNQNTSSDTKIAVLEERLSSYEVMMRKIDEAIQIMGKTSQNISKMLAVHEEKIENCGKTDEMISNMINEMKEENKEQHKKVSEKIHSLESKVDELAKFRWIIAGAAILLSFAVSQSSVVVDILTPDPAPVRVESTK